MIYKSFLVSFYFCLLILTLILTYHKKEQKKLLFYGGIITIAFLLISLVLSIISFNFMFTLFHNLFFPQGNWLFPANSLLIQTFPLGFFISISYKIFLLSLILGIIILFLGKKYKKKK